jgi:mannose-6-phosphate isomerase-like protein (cupin superfamily)
VRDLPRPRSLADELSRVTDFWSPRVVAALNGQYLKVARLKGEFVWHQHDAEDELFLVLKGVLRIQFEQGEVTVREGECIVVPRGVRHNPVADDECWIALFEPASTAHTGEVVTDRTRSIAEQTAHLERER